MALFFIHPQQLYANNALSLPSSINFTLQLLEGVWQQQSSPFCLTTNSWVCLSKWHVSSSLVFILFLLHKGLIKLGLFINCRCLPPHQLSNYQLIVHSVVSSGPTGPCWVSRGIQHSKGRSELIPILRITSVLYLGYKYSQSTLMQCMRTLLFLMSVFVSDVNTE